MMIAIIFGLGCAVGFIVGGAGFLIFEFFRKDD